MEARATREKHGAALFGIAHCPRQWPYLTDLATIVAHVGRGEQQLSLEQDNVNLDKIGT